MRRRLKSEVYGSITRQKDKSYDITIPQAIQMPSNYNPFIPLQHIHRVEAVVAESANEPAARSGFTEFGARLRERKEPAKPVGLTLGDFHMRFFEGDKAIEQVLRNTKLTAQQHDALNKVDKLNFRSVPIDETRRFCPPNTVQFDVYQGDNFAIRVPCVRPEDIVPKLLQLFNFTAPVAQVNPFTNAPFASIGAQSAPPSFPVATAGMQLMAQPQRADLSVLARAIREAKQAPATPVREAFGGETVDSKGWVFPASIKPFLEDVPEEKLKTMSMKVSPAEWFQKLDQWYLENKSWEERNAWVRKRAKERPLEAMHEINAKLDVDVAMREATQLLLTLMRTQNIMPPAERVELKKFQDPNWLMWGKSASGTELAKYAASFLDFINRVIDSDSLIFKDVRNQAQRGIDQYWSDRCAGDECGWLPDGLSGHLPLADVLLYYVERTCNSLWMKAGAKKPVCGQSDFVTQYTATSLVLLQLRDAFVHFFDPVPVMPANACDLVLRIPQLMDKYRNDLADVTLAQLTSMSDIFVNLNKTSYQQSTFSSIPRQRVKGFAVLLLILMHACEDATDTQIINRLKPPSAMPSLAP